MLTTRPQTTEYAPYYQRYIELVPEGSIADLLEQQLGDTVFLLGGVSDERAEHRYAPEKWSVKEVVGHLIDAERIFAYRALCIARGDEGPFPGFDENAYVARADFGRRALRDLVGEFVHVRRANVHCFRGLSSQAMMRTGTANGVSVSVRALAWIMAGHERHHMAILRERYL